MSKNKTPDNNSVTVASFVRDGLSRRGIPEEQYSRVVGNLAFASIRPEHATTANTRLILDEVLDRLGKRLGLDALADEDANKKPETQESAPSKDKPDTTTFQDPSANANTYASNLLKGIDPLTKEKLSTITLLGGVKALYNKNTRVTYPIPLTEKLQELL
jgi:hypothetical protein